MQPDLLTFTCEVVVCGRVEDRSELQGSGRASVLTLMIMIVPPPPYVRPSDEARAFRITAIAESVTR